MLEHIQKNALYAGLEKQEFDELLPEALKENDKNIRTYSLITLFLFTGLIIVNIFTSDIIDVNMRLYIITAIVNILVSICAHGLLPKHPGLTQPLTLVFTFALYGFALGVTSLHRDMPAVTAIVLLFVTPFLFSQRPVVIMAQTVLYVALLCSLSYLMKDARCARMDLWNGISFGAFAIVVGVLQMRARFRLLLQSNRIRYLSETDLLTGAKNRNHYESRQKDYFENCQDTTSCIFVDVNGLHNLNDTQGHAAGDVMLQTVARALLDCFGPEDVYRIGGDEFVVFRMDAVEEELRRDMARIYEALARQSYYISVGIATGCGSETDVTTLAAQAEQEMYESKREYYKKTGLDRRKR